MKKITNNANLGRLTLILSAVVLVCFIISMVLLMKFDKTNMVVVEERASYETAYEAYVLAQHPLRQDSAEVAYYQYKLDTLQQKTATSKDERKALDESIEVTKQTLSDKQKAQEEHIATAATTQVEYDAINATWMADNEVNDRAKSSFWVMAVITFIVFLVKTFFAARYGAKNSKNLHEAADWMKNGMKPYMSYVAWFVPIYNWIKPFTFIKEVSEETDYLLEDKGIVEKKQSVDNTGLHLGIWWGLMLISGWLMNYILYCTFFLEGALFIKANHSTIAIVAVIIMALAIAEEVYLILGYNKKLKLLVDNADKL